LVDLQTSLIFYSVIIKSSPIGGRAMKLSVPQKPTWKRAITTIWTLPPS